MSKKKAKKARHQKNNSQNPSAGLAPIYRGNARFFEIGSPTVLFRQFINLDQVTNIRFEESFEDRQIPVPGSAVPNVVDADGNEISPATPPVMQTLRVSAGFNVVVCFVGNNNAITFPDAKGAAELYNTLLAQISSLNVPSTRFPPIVIPEPEPAIDANVLHPDLAGGEGEGMAENDDDLDDGFKLSDEDLEALEHPVIDEDAIESAFDTLDEDPVEN